MKKMLVAFMTVFVLGVFAADILGQQPLVYAAAQSGAADQTDKDKTKGDGKTDDGHSGHH